MRNITIRARLLFGFGFFIAVIFIIAGMSIWSSSRALNEDMAIQERNKINAMILQWSRNVEANGIRTIAVANNIDSPAKESYAQQITQTSEQITFYQNEIGKLLSNPEGINLYNKILAARKNYTEPRAAALQLQGEGRSQESEDFFINKMPALIAAYNTSIDNLYQFQQRYVTELSATSQAGYQRAMVIMGLAALIAAVLGFWLAWRISKSISLPLSHAVVLAETVAKRDLSVSITPTGKDEITLLEQALQTMTDGLSQAVSDVHSGADAIAQASAQIAAGNLDLSSRTEQQSSSLAQTAATMEEMTATITQNADNAQQAFNLASGAAQVLTEGGQLVNELVQTMSNIDATSQQVSEIIGVIDSIAFQTNILALNAAVEAARAGEQGRGFAVVASEVRALAQRSAAAAKEIRELLETAVEASAKGNSQAIKAGTIMQDIVDNAQNVTDLMSEISSANREQQTGIAEINIAVAQMDDVTRQNASLVEESAAAASSLQVQADTLASLVASFHLRRNAIVPTAKSSLATYHQPELAASQPSLQIENNNR